MTLTGFAGSFSRVQSPFWSAMERAPGAAGGIIHFVKGR